MSSYTEGGQRSARPVALGEGTARRHGPPTYSRRGAPRHSAEALSCRKRGSTATAYRESPEWPLARCGLGADPVISHVDVRIDQRNVDAALGVEPVLWSHCDAMAWHGPVTARLMPPGSYVVRPARVAVDVNRVDVDVLRLVHPEIPARRVAQVDAAHRHVAGLVD